MNLSPESVSKLEALLSAASMVKIDNVIIEDGMIRGIDSDKSVVVLSRDNVPDTGGLRIGLNRLDDLAKRIQLTKNYNNFTIEALESEKRPGDISHLQITSTKTKLQFRTANPENIKAPKGLNDKQVWLVVVPKDDVTAVLQAANTMGSDEIIITSKQNGEVFFEFLDDVTQDSLSHKFADSATWIPEDSDKSSQSFVHYYRTKSLLPLMRGASALGDVTLIIGEKGMLWITVNGYDFTLIPRIGNK